MAKNKHAFHCSHCLSECMIYKKGKSHRVLVCPRCGVIATNGILKSIAKGALSLVPGGGLVTAGAEIAGDLLRKKPTTPTAPAFHRADDRARYAHKEYMLEKALE